MPLPPIKIADALQKAAYDDLAKGAMKQFGDAIAVMVSRVLDPHRKSAEELALDWQQGEEGSENRRRLAAEALDRVPPERRILPAPQIAGPIFRGSEFELPETPIWELWKRLLSRACDTTRLDEAHPAFPGIISQLAVAEANILEAYRRNEVPVIRYPTSIDPKTGDRGFGWYVLARNVPSAAVIVSVDHLIQMGLIKARNLTAARIIKTSQGEMRLDSNSQHYPLTAFGRLFLKAVVSPEER